jgi:Protein of unknown function (DUF2867)
MPKALEQEFERLPLRVHAFLADVPLHDVWAIDLPHLRSDVTLDEFLRMSHARLFTPSPIVRRLLSIRFFVGRIFGWDPAPSDAPSGGFAERLTPADRAASLEPAGKQDGPFRVVYRFENEQLEELTNRTAHAGALSALIETPASYRFYFAVYVRNVGRFTPFYMALIDPVRKLIVYPSLLRSVRTNWGRTIEDSPAETSNP